MIKRNQIYRCNICGNIVEVLYAGGGQLVCCGENMNLLEAKTEDQGLEKHMPVIEKKDGKVKVSVGSVLHPMEDEHYIEWIELKVDGKVYKQFLKPGDKPVAEFAVEGENLSAREYCNIHGLWQVK